ncbi:MAG: BatA domain-containing protein, partial [Tepidisphaeraceae bacterium]
MLMLTNHCSLLAWAITPGFFWAGLLLVALPIIIHILNRRRYKIVKWAAMEYLLQAMRKNRRRIQFEQLLLLAIRCILLALLGLALARPMGCADSTIASLAGQKSGLHIFVIDNSYSMSYESAAEAGKTHLDRAKAIARQYIERLARGSESVAIILASKAPTAGPSTRPTGSASPEAFVVLRPSFDLPGAADAIDRIDQSFLATDVVGALQAAVQLAREDTKQPQKF